MDPQRFDRFVRIIGDPWSSRRAALRLLGGGFAIALAANGPNIESASAKRKKRCKHGKERCKKRCFDPCPIGD
ncbi:MAG TPA: hypothetical protein VFI22_10555, partial [Thermomicrobiales bacterium]|nr:hypothetical protein [Thermomicrobiales bacterium]